ncbi:hypothetical protein BU23DRAFT_210796 [Bimuria novae-zelandiae CBS 107.79]|uniref:Uncharacterized protein n=1 Tax=Bimuria novae-zelandiae CBS 107.79 TaxID=1447943 RepID=A0A6A5V6E7_9PLEO|nr:hypothetical protein BU23DRAFT_210796 [Bimuria novae-zelandiae CBS 107.79]
MCNLRVKMDNYPQCGHIYEVPGSAFNEDCPLAGTEGHKRNRLAWQSSNKPGRCPNCVYD